MSCYDICCLRSYKNEDIELVDCIAVNRPKNCCVGDMCGHEVRCRVPGASAMCSAATGIFAAVFTCLGGTVAFASGEYGWSAVLYGCGVASTVGTVYVLVRDSCFYQT